MRKSLTRIALLLLSLGLVALTGCSNEPETDDPAIRTEQAASPKPATPNLSDIEFTLRDESGNIHTADEWIGKKPVVINFWGTWCGPCRKEIPDMVKVYEEYAGQVEILGIAMNDTPEKVATFIEQNNMDWVMLLGEAETAMLFGVRGIPTTFFLDAQGNVVQVEDYNGTMVNHFVGPRDYDTFKRAIETIIRKSQTS